MEKKYILEGLDCPNCALKVEKALNKHPHIKEANVNAATLLCMIDYKEYDETIEKGNKCSDSGNTFFWCNTSVTGRSSNQ